MTHILCIPADNNGNKLWIKDFEKKGNKMFLKYRSSFNDIPFLETEVFFMDGGKNIVITGDDGTVIFRFSEIWIKKLMNN